MVVQLDDEGWWVEMRGMKSNSTHEEQNLELREGKIDQEVEHEMTSKDSRGTH